MNRGSKEIAIEGFLVGLSIVIGIIEHQFSLVGISILQGISLIPIFLIRDMFGIKASFWCLFSSTLIRSIFFSCAGVLGFIMRMTSFIYMIFRGKKGSNLFQMYCFDLIGIILSIIVKVPFSYIFWKQIYSFEKLGMIYGIIKIVFPTNFLRLLISVILSRFVKIEKKIEKIKKSY